MQARQKPAFDTPVRRQIYEYVERRGLARVSAMKESLDVDRQTFDHELAMLKRDGHVEEHDGRLYVTLEAGTAEEFTSDGLTYEVRPAQQDDLTGIIGAIRVITAEQTDLVAESVGEQLDHEGVLIRHNEAETRMFFVATVGDDVVGWAHVEAPQVEKLSHAAKLTVGVIDEYRDHGIGSDLLRHSLDWATEQGYRKVYNSIPATNQAAAQFLEAHGFETEAIRKDHYRIDGEFVAELMMAKTLQ